MRTNKSLITPAFEFIKDVNVRKSLEDLFTLIEDININVYSDLRLFVTTLSVNDTSPSVRDGDVFITANTQATAISDFDNATDGKQIVIICNDVNTSIADSGNFKLSVAWTPGADDTLTLVHYDGVWYEIARSAN